MFTILGESTAASEDRRYIAMDKSMHVSRVACVSAFETVRAVRPVRTWPALTFTRLRERVRGANTNICQILRLKMNKPLLPALVSRPTWRGVGFIGLRTRFVQRGRRAGRASHAVKNTTRTASQEVPIRTPFQCNRQSSPDYRKPESIIPHCQAHYMTHRTRSQNLVNASTDHVGHGRTPRTV